MMVLRGDSEKVRSGAKTRPSGTTANTLPRDDDAKGPSSDPAERRKALLSPSGTASVARRSPNGRPASLRPTREWARKIPARASLPRDDDVLTQDDEAIILVYRWRTRLPLDDCLDRLQRTPLAIPTAASKAGHFSNGRTPSDRRARRTRAMRQKAV